MYKYPALPMLCVGFFNGEPWTPQPGLLRDATEGIAELLGLQW